MLNANEAYNLTKQAQCDYYKNAYKEIERGIKEKAKEGYTSYFYVIDKDFLSEDRIVEIERCLEHKGYQYRRRVGLLYGLEIYWG